MVLSDSHEKFQMAAFPEGLKMIFHNATLSQLKKFLSLNGIIKFRVLDIFASISSISVEALHLCESRFVNSTS